MLKIGGETAWDGKADLTGSVQWKDVGDVIPSNHVDTETFLLAVTQMNSQLTEASSSSVTDKIWIDKEYSECVVSETKLPDRIVCYDRGASQSVKDIRLVDSLHFPQKCLLENDDAAEKISSKFESSATNTNTHLSFATNEDNASTPQDLESASSNDNKPPWKISEADENSKEKIKIGISHQENSLEQLLPLGDSVGMPNQTKPTNFDMSIDIRQSTNQKVVEEVVEGEKLSRIDMPLDIAESEKVSKMLDNTTITTSEVTMEEEHSESGVAFSDVASSGTEENPVNDELRTGETHMDLASPAAMVFERKESKENIHSKHIVQIHNSSASVDTNSDSATASARSSFYQKDHSDLNLQSGPFYLSGPKTSSAHIAYSGSISLRSDSSTTSTRSFAFPILQSEWNTSPVKMAKADHRRRRKCWPWTGICCCKF